MRVHRKRCAQRKILITGKCTMAFKNWREKGESFKFRVDRYTETCALKVAVCILEVMSAKAKATKTKTARAQAGNVQSK